MNIDTNTPTEPNQTPPGAGTRPIGRHGWRISIGAAILLAAIFLLTRPGQGKARASAVAEKAPTPQPVVVAPVKREDLSREMTVPAEFRPYVEVELHSKVAGFVEGITVDMGDQVKAGQLLATLEIPELKDELDRAIATEKRAEADYRNAHLAYTRLLSVNAAHPHLVAQQELDTAESRDGSAEATIAAAKADVEKFETLFDYTKIRAPFDGVITRRYADPGALVQAGTASDTQTMPLVRLSNNYRLRLDFPVSVDFAQNIKPGETVDVRVESLHGKTFSGKVTRFSHRVDESTRTMTVEMEVDNPKLELVPGMYAKAVLKVEQHPQVLSVPIEAVSSSTKPTVFVVSPDGTVAERPITLGLETPTRYEVLAGVKEGELVMVGNPGQIKPGEKVVARQISQLAAR